MFQLTKRFSFEASHQLMNHDGKCRHLHGHSWQGALKVRCKSLMPEGPKENMVVDYAALGQLTDEIEATYDHKHLNDVLEVAMPTSEYLARTIYESVTKHLMEPLELVSVTISETCSTECEYFG